MRVQGGVHLLFVRVRVFGFCISTSHLLLELHDDLDGHVEDAQFGLRLVRLQMLHAHAPQLLERFVDIPNSDPIFVLCLVGQEDRGWSSVRGRRQSNESQSKVVELVLVVVTGGSTQQVQRKRKWTGHRWVAGENRGVGRKTGKQSVTTRRKNETSTSNTRFQLRDDVDGLLEHRQLGLSLIALQVNLTHAAQFLERFVYISNSHPTGHSTFNFYFIQQSNFLFKKIIKEKRRSRAPPSPFHASLKHKNVSSNPLDNQSVPSETRPQVQFQN